jgi:hypothetical protein
MCANAHDVVEDTSELSKEHSNVLGAEWNINVEQLLHCQGIALHENKVEQYRTGTVLSIWNFCQLFYITYLYTV